jgi:hypothetical protein
VIDKARRSLDLIGVSPASRNATGKDGDYGAGYEVRPINRRIMDKLGYLSSSPCPAGPHICRDVILREQLLDEIHHGDGRVAVRGDLLEEQVDHLAPNIDAFAVARYICLLRCAVTLVVSVFVLVATEHFPNTFRHGVDGACGFPFRSPLSEFDSISGARPCLFRYQAVEDSRS